ncbi:uncharacterized protein LOC104882927 [Beta vulgaris subsp. vulgaris]|uniref:uncharacterized protein LOC104882927 n=1 Tax=Beta vulgaris subsp. vulgaris TaxID=3555 RepID=UPI00053F7A53|nr:uncharacterized protein LOC104882927 [Beta vulgaris subsp. vulgaris]
MDLAKDVLHTVPMWIQLHKLDIKYWGDKSLFKIAGKIGKVLKTDQASSKKDRLQYARVLIEDEVNQVFPNHVRFVNEKDNIVQIDVVYEWKPEKCEGCKQFGHICVHCKKKDDSKVWQRKATAVDKPQKKNIEADTDGFRKVVSSPRLPSQKSNPVNTQNSFQVLAVEEVNVGDVVCEIGVDDARRVECPPAPNE